MNWTQKQHQKKFLSINKDFMFLLHMWKVAKWKNFHIKKSIQSNGFVAFFTKKEKQNPITEEKA